MLTVSEMRATTEVMSPIAWKDLRYFTADELRCPCGCGRADMTVRFMFALDDLRHRAGFPIMVNSGFRCPEYDATLGGKGNHPSGEAADIGVSFHRAWALLRLLPGTFEGIGIRQHGEAAGRFMHLDMRGKRFWTYS